MTCSLPCANCITAHHPALPCAFVPAARHRTPLCVRFSSDSTAQSICPDPRPLSFAVCFLQAARHICNMVIWQVARSTCARHVHALPCASSRQWPLPCALTRQTDHMSTFYSVFWKSLHFTDKSHKYDRIITIWAQTSQFEHKHHKMHKLHNYYI